MSIYDKIKNKKDGIWTCRATSTKAHQDIGRDKCYPRVGVTYTVVNAPETDEPSEVAVGSQPMYVWREDNTPEGKVEDKQSLPWTKKSLKLVISEDAPPKDHLHQKYPHKFPKQEKMLPAFVAAFNSVRFTEFSDNVMVSSPAVVKDPMIRNGDLMAVVFILTIVDPENNGREALRITQLWSDDYLGTPPVC